MVVTGIEYNWYIKAGYDSKKDKSTTSSEDYQTEYDALDPIGDELESADSAWDTIETALDPRTN